mmetsp:Transcript_34044/g.44985  ORF Transcript_34044/g.44985 Transcript_34044/m.44985 type:complete len:771 (-) Transcript_34044:68-2380(-)
MYMSPAKIREQAREELAAHDKSEAKEWNRNTNKGTENSEGLLEQKDGGALAGAFDEGEEYLYAQDVLGDTAQDTNQKSTVEEVYQKKEEKEDQPFGGVVYQRIPKKGWEPFLCQLNQKQKHEPLLEFYPPQEDGISLVSKCHQQIPLKGAKVIGRGVIKIHKIEYYAFQILYPKVNSSSPGFTTKYAYIWIGLKTREDYEIWVAEMEKAVKSAVTNIMRGLSFRTRKPRRGDVVEGKRKFLGTRNTCRFPQTSSQSFSRPIYSKQGKKKKDGLTVSFADMFAEGSEDLNTSRKHSDKGKLTKIRRTPTISSRSSASRKGNRSQGELRWGHTPTTDPLQRGFIHTQMGRRVKGNASYIADRVSSRTGQRIKIFAPQPIPRPKTRQEDPSSLMGALPPEVIKAVIKGEDKKVISFIQFSGWGWDHMLGGQGERLMNIAAQHQRASLISALIEAGADVNGKDGSGETILCTAAKYGRWHICEILLGAGADPNLADFHDDTPLCHACAGSHREAAHLLLLWGASPTQANFRGITPFITACSQGDPRIVQMLMASEEELKGMVPNPKDPVQAKAKIISQTESNTMEEKLSSGSQTDGKEKEPSTTDVLVVNTELSAEEEEEEKDATVNGINLEHKTTSGITALYAASQRGHVEVVNILIEKGARVQECNLQGMTPLYAAAEQGHHYVVDKLLQVGADPSFADNKGDTALHAAVRSGSTKTVLHLMNLNAVDISKMNSQGETPLSMIKNSSYIDKKQVFELYSSRLQQQQGEFPSK